MCESNGCVAAAEFEVHYGVPMSDVEHALQFAGRKIYTDVALLCRRHTEDVFTTYVHVGVRVIGTAKPLRGKKHFDATKKRRDGEAV